MTHWILQFALRIAVRSVLHRCASLDIHCWKLLSNKTKNFRSQSIIRNNVRGLKVHQQTSLLSSLAAQVLPKTTAKKPPSGASNYFHRLPYRSKVNYKRSETKQYSSRGKFYRCGNDPSAGSPTETLLRLHLPLNGEVKKSSHQLVHNEASESTVPIFHRVIQSVGATGGVYKGQGRNQCKLMTCVY